MSTTACVLFVIFKTTVFEIAAMGSQIKQKGGSNEEAQNETFIFDLLSSSNMAEPAFKSNMLPPRRESMMGKKRNPRAMDDSTWWEGNLLDVDVDCGVTIPLPGSSSLDSDQDWPKGLQPENQFDEKTKSAGKEKSKDGTHSVDIRKRRRREFHKIHTRRSRAKLNERMESLRRALPHPPTGLVVKSKAQIVDFAICVLDELLCREVHAKMKTLQEALPQPPDGTYPSSLGQLLEYATTVLNEGTLETSQDERFQNT